MLSAKFSKFIGVAGVDRNENLAARRAGMVLEVPMLLAAVWILLSWFDDTHSSYTVFDIYLWGFFVVETGLLAVLVTNTGHYLRNNWLSLVIVVLGIPMLLNWQIHLGVLRLLRLIIVFTLLAHLSGRIAKMLGRNELGATVLATVIVIIMAGIMMSALDPAIESPLDGVWWAWVTITTVGYGDVVPSSGVGRVFASVIIFLGLGLFALLTARFAAFFLSQKEDKIISSEQSSHKRLTELERRLTEMDRKIDRLLSRLDDDQGN